MPEREDMRIIASAPLTAVVSLLAIWPQPAAAQESRWEQAVQCAGAMTTAAQLTANQASVAELHGSFTSLRDAATKLVAVAAPGRGLTPDQASATVAAKSQEVRARVLAAEPAERQSTFFAIMEVEMANCRKLSDAAKADGLIP